MPTDPTRVKAIFLEAAELPDDAARAAYLDRTCGADAGLRERVEALFRSHDPDGSFLGTPAAVIPGPDHAATRAFEPHPDHAATRTGGGSSSDDEVPLGFLAPATRPDSLGRIGHYEVLQVIGQGGFGIVFRAFDDVLHRVVAVKVLAPQLAATSPARRRFVREARSSAQVRHENVVQVYEVGETPLPYIAMEFIPGETLQERLNRIGPVEPAEVVRIGRQIAEGLAAAHATDLIHRDIKPGNILLEGGAGRVKITDFGLARAADDASISQSGIIAGTPMYMAPEQALGAKLDQRADLFSLGSVLYQMAAGRAPFRANSTVAVLKRVAEDTPRDIREIVPEVPQWLCDIISKLHAKNPDDRYQSAREVADVLADCEAQLKANSRLKDFSRIPRGKARPSGRRKWVAAAAVLLLPVIALAVTEFAGVTHLVRSERDPIKPDPINPGQEPSSLEVPRTAADVLPFLAGNWKTTSPPTVPNLPPDTGRDAQYTTFDFVAGGKFLRQRGMRHAIFAFDAEKGVLRQWAAASAAPSGLMWGPAVGLFNPTNHTVTWTVRSGGGNEVTHQGDHVDANTIDLRAFLRDAKDNVVQNLPVRLTRVHGPVTLPDWPAAPTRPPEMKILDRLVGEWRNEVTVHDVAQPDQSKVQTGRVKVELILGGRFVESIGTSETVDHNDYALAWYDSDAKKYRQWLFNGSGNFIEMTGRWDEAAKTLTWASSDGGYERRWDFKDDDLHGFWNAIRAADGKVLKSSDGVSRRIAPSTPPPTYTNGIGMEFVKVPKGKSWLGGGKDKLGDKEVEIPADFYLGKYEVTQEQWEKVMGENPSHFSRMGEGKDAVKDISDADLKRFPVEMVSWDQCQVFVAKLNQREKEVGWVYRLPTEVEWEYVCRGGPMADKGDSAFDFYLAKPTNTLLPEQANFGPDGGLNRTCKVGSYASNRLGLFDMHGNVFEWCDDTFKDPRFSELHRVHIGGSWHAESATWCRAGGIVADVPSKASNYLGLRLARVPVSAPPEAKTPQIGTTPFTDADVKRIAALPAPEQVEEVRKELVRRNPGFDGQVEHKIEGGVVTEFGIVTDQVTDVAPVRVFNALRVLNLSGTQTKWRGNGQLADLSPLAGMNLAGLTHLNLNYTHVTDAGLANFKDCKNLTVLGLDNTQVTDAGLVNFKGCTGLTSLSLSRTRVTDAGLANFKDCKQLTRLYLDSAPVGDAGVAHFRECENLTVLHLGFTRVTDAGLARLKDCKKLERLNLAGTSIGDAGLAHLKDCRALKWLHIWGTEVTDLSLLKGMSLKELSCDFQPDRDAEILRSIKTLETINGKPAAEFWKDVEKK